MVRNLFDKLDSIDECVCLRTVCMVHILNIGSLLLKWFIFGYWWSYDNDTIIKWSMTCAHKCILYTHSFMNWFTDCRLFHFTTPDTFLGTTFCMLCARFIKRRSKADHFWHFQLNLTLFSISLSLNMFIFSCFHLKNDHFPFFLKFYFAYHPYKAITLVVVTQIRYVNVIYVYT